MFVKDVNSYEEKVVLDNTNLRELLNPGMGDFQIRYSLAQARVSPGETSYKHKLSSSEAYFILSGAGRMYIDDEFEDVHAGSIIYILPNSVQCIQNIGNDDLVFLCIVDPAWDKENDVLVD